MLTYGRDDGYLGDEGHLLWEGRPGKIIKTGGANVSPLEIDEDIQTMPGVRMMKAIGIAHDSLGEEVISCIVRHEGMDSEAEEVRAFARTRLASYKVPRHGIFLREEDLALTTSGKLKAADLKDIVSQQLR